MDAERITERWCCPACGGESNSTTCQSCGAVIVVETPKDEKTKEVGP